MAFRLKSISEKVIQALSQGTTPKMLALTVALGIVLGIFPLLGTTTLLCFGASVLLRLNIPIIQLVNYLVAPLQILLIIPFIQAGSFVFGLEPFPYDVDQLMVLFKTDFWLLLKETGIAALIGIGVWAVASVPLFVIIFFPLVWAFSKWKAKR